jgi:anti-sigma-K factor RskA
MTMAGGGASEQMQPGSPAEMPPIAVDEAAPSASWRSRAPWAVIALLAVVATLAVVAGMRRLRRRENRR